MRIVVKTQLPECPERLAESTSDRLRCALGSHSDDVQRVSVRLHEEGGTVVCSMHLRLRGDRVLDVASEGPTVDEAVRFCVRRAGAAVARRVDTDRILRS